MGGGQTFLSTPFQIPVADGLMVLMHEELANKEVTSEDEDCGLVIAAVIRSNLHLHLRSVCCAVIVNIQNVVFL